MKGPRSLLLIAATLLLVSYTFALAQTGGKTTMPAQPTPTLEQVIGSDGQATIGPTRYPVFSSFVGEDPACQEYLKRPYNPDAPNLDPAVSGLSRGPLWIKSLMGDTTPAPLPGRPAYARIRGLVKERYTLPRQYRNATTRLLISWEVVIEATTPAAMPIRTGLCRNFFGTSNQTFQGGLVNSQLYINGRAYGPVASLSIMDTKFASITQPRPRRDPTLTGSVVVPVTELRELLDGRPVDIEIKWYNDTSLALVSLPDFRSMSIAVEQLTKQQR